MDALVILVGLYARTPAEKYFRSCLGDGSLSIEALLICTDRT